MQGTVTMVTQLLPLVLLACSTPATSNTLGLADLTLELTRGQVLVLRHALAPGGGDPSDFDVDDCSTQRNLDSAGREQSVQIGSDLRFLGVNFSKVLSSPWCRCLETATLMDVGKVETVSFLGSFYQAPPIGFPKAATVQALRDYLGSNVDACAPPQLFVSHHVVVVELSGFAVDSGDGILYDPVTGTSRRVSTDRIDRTKQVPEQQAVLMPTGCPCPRLAAALYAIGGSVCTEAAGAAMKECPTSLHLRNAGIDAATAVQLACALAEEVPALQSFSVSYNNISDAGAVALVNAMPPTVTEIGMVGCGISDTGGQALAAWARTDAAKQLSMLCVEENMFSASVQQSLTALGGSSRGSGFAELSTLVVSPQDEPPPGYEPGPIPNLHAYLTASSRISLRSPVLTSA
eukprot:959690-Rhodomonas_salina.2